MTFFFIHEKYHTHTHIYIYIIIIININIIIINIIIIIIIYIPKLINLSISESKVLKISLYSFSVLFLLEVFDSLFKLVFDFFLSLQKFSSNINFIIL